MDWRKKVREICELDETTISIQKLKTDAIELARKFYIKAESVCGRKEGLERKLCYIDSRIKSIVEKRNRLKYSIGRCKYTKKPNLCIKILNDEIIKAESSIKELDDKRKKEEQINKIKMKGY